jgi:hypothetical protein
MGWYVLAYVLQSACLAHLRLVVHHGMNAKESGLSAGQAVMSCSYCMYRSPACCCILTSIGPQGGPIDDESHVLGSCVATNALLMDPRFSALPFTDIRALMSCRDSHTVALFVHRCMCVGDDAQAQRA